MDISRGDQRVAVIGGGISGLSAAHRLVASGTSAEITVFESTSRLGGVLQTEIADGFCIEFGPDSLLSRLPWGVDLCRRIGLADELLSTNELQRGAYVVCRGGLQKVPDGLAVMAPQKIRPFVTTPILSWRGKLRLAAEALIPRQRRQQEESLAEFSRRRLGREVFERLVQPLAGGIYMGDPERLSVQATFPQFVEMESQHGSLIRAARFGRAKGHPPSTTGGPQYSLFVAPRRGTSQLVQALASRLANCRIRCGHRVEQLLPSDQVGWSVKFVDETSGDRRWEQFSGVILAVPAYLGGSLLQQVNPELGRMLGGIPYAGCVVVNLAYRRQAIAHPLGGFGFVVPHIERRSVLACTFSSVKYAQRAPEGKALLRAFLGGACFPDVLTWSDERLLQVVRHELDELLGLNAEPLFSRITRWPRAMPQYQIGHLQKVQRIAEIVQGMPGLELAGNAYHGVGIPHCVRGGEQAGERLLAWLDQPATQLDDQGGARP